MALKPSVESESASSVETIETLVGLRALASEWESLFQDCERPSLCALHAWVVSWWESFGDRPEGAGRDTALFVVVVRDRNSRMVGALPLFEERAPWGSLKVRRLRSVGFLGREGVYDMTEEPTFLIRPGWETAVLGALAGALRPHLRRGRWDLVFLRCLDADGRRPFETAFGRLRPGFVVRTDARTGSCLAPLPRTWAEYRKGLTKSMRDNLGYYPRLLTLDGHDWEVRFLRAPGEMAGAADRLVRLHRSRACPTRGKRHNDHIHGSVQEAFLKALLERLAAQGRALVAELVVGGRVVASQAFVEDREELMVYYSGYDEAWYGYSPVFVIGAAAFEDAMGRGVRRLNFLRAPAAWKGRWGAISGPAMGRAFVVPYRAGSWLRIGIYLARVLWTRDVVPRLPVLVRRARRRLARRP